MPPARLDEVAEHYLHFGGVSPINAQNRALIAALETELAAHGPRLPIYFGNRNWHPFVTDTIRRMRDDGVERALVFVTSAFSSYSGCRQYREDVIRALETLGADAPTFDKLRVFYNHPGFIDPMIARTRAALDRSLPNAANDDAPRFHRPQHSARDGPALRLRSATAGDEPAVARRRRRARITTWRIRAGVARPRSLARTGHPRCLGDSASDGATDVVVVPVGFISDHMEVLFDLDTEARETAARLGLNLVRAATVGTDPAFVGMIRDLIVERMTPFPDRPAVGNRGPNHDVCPLHCCLIGSSRPAASAAAT